jgi:hypothetical protein
MERISMCSYEAIIRGCGRQCGDVSSSAFTGQPVFTCYQKILLPSEVQPLKIGMFVYCYTLFL